MSALPRRNVPEHDRLVVTRRGEDPAIGTERDAMNRPGMSAEHMEFRARVGVPKLDGLVHASGSESVPVGTVDDARHDSRMGAKCEDLFARRGIPQLHVSKPIDQDEGPP